MSSTNNSRLRYLQDRCVNAYWMLRTGKFKLIFKSIYVELTHRARLVQSLLARSRPQMQMQMQIEGAEPADSAFVNLRKVLPPSYRPTVAQPPIPVVLRADPEAIGNDIKRILGALGTDEGKSP